MSKFTELAKSRMDKVISNFESNLSVIRTGRPNPNMISGIEIDYYGAPTPLSQMGQITVVEGTQLVVKLFDPSQLRAVEKAINAANLGLNAQNDGVVVRMLVPALTEATRKDLTKDVNKLLEEAKVAIRNERRDVNDLVKKTRNFARTIKNANSKMFKKQRMISSSTPKQLRLLKTKKS